MPEPFDDTAKAFYRELFESWGLRVEPEQEIYSRSRRIDLLVDCSTGDQTHVRETVFHYFRRFNALEFKGPRDPLTLVNYNRIMMRAWGLGGIEPRKKARTNVASDFAATIDREALALPTNRTLTIICVARPDRVLDEFGKALEFQRTETAGVYHSPGPLNCWILVPSELPLSEAYYPLLPLARGARLEEFLALCLREGYTDYLRLALDVGMVADPDAVWNRLMEGINMQPVWTKKSIQIVDDAFRKSPDLPFMFPTIKERFETRLRTELEKQVAEQVQQQVAEQVQQQVAEQVQQQVAEKVVNAEHLGEEHGELKARQATLLRLLERKFNEVPAGVERRIQGTDKTSTLDQWLDRILDAESLQQMGLE